MKSKISEQISSETSEEDKENVRKYVNNIINKLEMKYYLINNKIMKGGEIPKSNLDEFSKLIHPNISIEHLHWLNSLQTCSIKDVELDNIKNHIYFKLEICVFNTNPIEVTDIVEEKKTCESNYAYCKSHGECTLMDCKSLFTVIFKQPKSEYNEAVEFKTWCDGLNNEQKIKSSFKGIVTEFNNEELYEIFKTQKK